MDREQLAQQIRAEVEAHLDSLGMGTTAKLNGVVHDDKDVVRAMHSAQRLEVIAQERKSLPPLLVLHLSRHFANGYEVDPLNISPELVPVHSDDETGLLFRLATLLWSIPVSKGYGRRMRFLVTDRANGKLIGVLALKDPVFNLKVRDEAIGWTVRDREARLVSVMDAYVVGAIPPYSQLLGGKLVTCLLGSDEISSEFHARYAGVRGIISQTVKPAALALITITSALGRSSIYNRVKLPGLVELKRVGVTEGWGHFHVPGPLFEDMRRLLEMDEHSYASGHRFGQGPNWRIRVIREALARVGLDSKLVRHGVAREVFMMPLAKNWQAYLKRESDDCVLDRPSATVIAEACRARWIVPRASRYPEYRTWTREDTLELLRAIGL